MDPVFASFFAPRGIVIVGVSRDPSKLGFGLIRNLVKSGYAGALHLVNPKGGTILDHPVYPDVASVPDPADLAIIAAPAPAVMDTLRAVHARGIRAAIIASAGFKEVGAEGAALEAELGALARELGVRIVGPNCIGIADMHLPMDTTFLPPPATAPGEIAFISHSGAVCGAVTDLANGRGFGFSKLVSLGNQVDLTETDFLEALADDPRTSVITLYMEGVGDGRRFVDAASRVARQKPVLAIKVGRSAGGRRAASSHTGALAGAEEGFDAAFRRSGVIRVDTLEQLFDWARALAWCPLPRGRAVAILTNAGGPGVLAADVVESNGLELANLTEDTRAALRRLLPAAASVANPVDMLAAANAELFATCLGILLADPNVHGVAVLTPPPPMTPPEAVAAALLPVIRGSAKPVVVGLLGASLVRPAAQLLADARIAVYSFPEQTISALGVLARRAEWLAAAAPPAAEPSVRGKAAWEALERARLALGEAGGWLPPEDAAAVLEAYGIAVPRIQAAGSAAQAAEMARTMGFPVAMKLASPDITHKSDVGGVVLGLGSREAVEGAFETVMRAAKKARPDARLLGVHLQKMLPPGQEVIVGAVRDPQFGPLVMFGSGGVEVEGLKDVTFALAPLPRAEAEAMLERTWAGRKLRGFRNLASADRDAVLDVLVRLARLAADFPEIAEVEVNPLRALAAGQGAVAVDVRIRISGAAA